MTTALSSSSQFAVQVSMGRRHSSGKITYGKVFWPRYETNSRLTLLVRIFYLLWIQMSFFVIEKQCILHDLKRRKPVAKEVENKMVARTSQTCACKEAQLWSSVSMYAFFYF